MFVLTNLSGKRGCVSDIMQCHACIHGFCLSLQTGNAKEVTSKTGKKLVRCEIKLFDDTAPRLPLIL